MIIQADARQLPIASGTVQCVVTSPPYWGLRSYGTPPQIWDGLPGCEHEWRDRISVNATNHTDKRRWNHTRNGRDEEQPIEKRVAWLRTLVDQGNVCQQCGAWRGSLGLEPNPELYVQHIVEVFREIRRVLREDGTVWANWGDSYFGGNKGNSGPIRQGDKQATNIGSWDTRRRDTGTLSPTRSGGYDGLKTKDLCGIPWRCAFALQEDGWYLRSDIIWSKPNPMPESVTDRPTKSHEYLFLMAKSERYFYDAEAIKEPADLSNWRDCPTARRETTGPTDSGFQNGRYFTSRNKRSVWTIATQPYSGSHFATFPEKLVETCLLAGSRPGDLVFDPFVGSGTVIRVATRLQRKGVGCDLNFEYLSKQAKKRMSKVQVEMQYANDLPDPPGDTPLPAEA